MWLYDLIIGINLFGMGSAPIAWAIAGIVAIGMNQRMVKERGYNDALKTFWIIWLVMILTGIDKNGAILFGLYTILFTLGTLFNKKTQDQIVHTVSKKSDE